MDAATRSLIWEHYLDVLERKPGAMKVRRHWNSGVELAAGLFVWTPSGGSRRNVMARAKGNPRDDRPGSCRLER